MSYKHEQCDLLSSWFWDKKKKTKAVHENKMHTTSKVCEIYEHIAKHSENPDLMRSYMVAMGLYISLGSVG